MAGEGAVTTSRTSGRGVWAVVGKGAAARLLVLPVSAVLGILVTRLLIDGYGEAAYAQYLLLVSMAALIPFADLGISAPVTNAVAGAHDPRSDEHLYRTLVSALRVVAGAALVVLLVTGVISLVGAWPTLLGEGLVPGSGPVAAALCLAVFGLGILVGFGQRVLVGLHLNHVVVLLQGLQTPIVLGVLLLLVHGGVARGGEYLAVVAYAATAVVAVVALLMARRRIAPTLGRAVRGAARVRSVRGAPVFATAWPMALQMVAMPVAMQSDKLVLSHVSTVPELARYSLAAQIFLPVVSVVSAAGTSLWPVFARERADGERRTSPQRVALVFAGAGAVVTVAMAAASGVLAEVASDGRITLPTGLVVAFCVYVVLNAASFPLGSYLTDARGLRFQALMLLAMVPVNLGLSLVLGARLGAVGPVIGSIVGVALFRVVANLVYISRADRRGRAAPVEG